MVKVSDFSDDLESELITLYLYKKHLAYLSKVQKETRKTRSQQIRDLIDVEIRKGDRY
jgi:hypothetical protein